MLGGLLHSNRSLVAWLLVYSWFGDVSVELPAPNSFSPAVIAESFICRLTFEFRSVELEMMTCTSISYTSDSSFPPTNLSLKSLYWSLPPCCLVSAKAVAGIAMFISPQSPLVATVSSFSRVMSLLLSPALLNSMLPFSPSLSVCPSVCLSFSLCVTPTCIFLLCICV